MIYFNFYIMIHNLFEERQEGKVKFYNWDFLPFNFMQSS